MVRRRAFLQTLGLAAAEAAPPPSAIPWRRPSQSPPRKILIGAVIQPFWGPYPGLQKRLDHLASIVDAMAREARQRYGRGLDLAILPEAAVTGEVGSEARKRAVPFAGPVSGMFTRKAREYGCYIVAPAYLREVDDPARCSNAAVLVDRRGRLAGIYRKVHLVVAADGKTMEGGSTPGREVPVFSCDFGKLGIQICYDMEFDRGWQELARQGAELVAWPTQSPQTAQPAARAVENRCYIVSSTWRHNASIFEPTGKIAAQITESGRVLVQELDLSYAILPWSAKLRNGKALQEKYGGRIGFRYYEDEDLGIFWSNDPQTPVGRMAQSLDLREADEELARARAAYRAAGVLDY